jgi:nucleoside phosphorylase
MVLFGTAGGFSEKVEPGSVVIAKNLVRYDFGVTENGEFNARSEPWPPLEPWVLHLIDRFIHSHGSDPIILECNGAPYQVYYGTIGTANIMVMDKKHERVQTLKRVAQNALVVEMEAAGFLTGYSSARKSFVSPPDGYLIIRAISDKADPNKAADEKGGKRSRSLGNALHCLCQILGMCGQKFANVAQLAQQSE